MAAYDRTQGGVNVDRTQPPQYELHGTRIEDRINPVTGQSYGSRFASAPGNPLSSWQANVSNVMHSYSQPNGYQGALDQGQSGQVKQDVAQGADFMQYQNQLQGLLNDPSQIKQSAAYKFNLNQGNQAINRSAAARGMLGSGNVLAELAKYGQGMASQEYGNQFNRLSDLMKNSQQFGIQAGYYKPPAKSGGWSFSNEPSWY